MSVPPYRDCCDRCVHTDTRETGHLATPMRWRPDLVTATDDTGLTPTDDTYQVGRFTGRVYHRDGGSMAHLRLDDGYRWVGADVDRNPDTTWPDRRDRAWERLTNELSRPDHQVPEPGVRLPGAAEVDECLRRILRAPTSASAATAGNTAPP